MTHAAEGVLVLEAAHATDALAALRALSMDGKTLTEINSIQRLEIAWSQAARVIALATENHA